MTRVGHRPASHVAVAKWIFSPYQSTRLSRYDAASWALGANMRRREFVALVSGAAAWSVAARAQQGQRLRRVGALMNLAVEDPVSIARAKAFAQGLQALGWIDGRNVQVDYRWAAGNADLFQRYAAELVALAPEVILAAGAAALPVLLQATRTIPIVFVHVTDPVGNAYVASLSRPGGNATGFLLFEYNLAAKWVEVLKE